MVRVEAKSDALDKRIDDLKASNESGFDEVNKKIDRLEDKFDSYFKWELGLILISIYGLIGFIIYDRRTTLALVENETERIIKSLREAAEKDPVLREALKKTALW